jgi:hypothetical protein
MHPSLARPRAVQPRVPALDQLLHRADVDASVVQYSSISGRYAARNRRSIPIELPHREHGVFLGDVRLDELSVCAPASSSDIVELRMASSNPLWCASLRRLRPSRRALIRLGARRGPGLPAGCSGRRRSPVSRSRRSRAGLGPGRSSRDPSTPTRPQDYATRYRRPQGQNHRCPPSPLRQ